MVEARSANALATSIVLPVCEGDRGIGALLTAVRAFAREFQDRVEVVVVDDATERGVESHVARWRAQFAGLVIATHDKRKGRGAAARTGLLAARGDNIVVVDPDLSVPLENAELLIERLRLGADLALISRHAEGAVPEAQTKSFLERATATTVMRLSELMVPVGVRDCFAGLVGMRSRAAKKIAQRSQVSSQAYVVEWIALAQYLGFQVLECPQTWVRGPMLAERERPRTSAFALLRDVWATRKRFAADDYSRGLPASTLLSETSFHKLDRDVLGLKKR